MLKDVPLVGVVYVGTQIVLPHVADRPEDVVHDVVWPLAQLVPVVIVVEQVVIGAVQLVTDVVIGGRTQIDPPQVVVVIGIFEQEID